MRRQSGVSLLEVLVSIFVLSVGLLAVAALIPVAGHSVREATKSDQAAACGQAVVCDLKVRGVIDLDKWSRADGTPVSTDPTSPTYDPVSTQVPIGVHKWYRIIATGETVSEDANGDGVLDPTEDLNNNGAIDWYREVTLDGPDWNLDWAVQLYPAGKKDSALATLLTDVIGVYTTVIEREW